MAFTSTPSWFGTPIQINSTAISGDGSRCILGTSNEYSSGVFSVVAYDDSGNVLWTDPVTNTSSYQGVFWVAISDDGNFAAAGGETEKSGSMPGFLRAYDVSSGESILNLSLPRRVNQVSLSNNGSILVAAYGQYISLFQKTTNSYEQVGVYDLGENFDCNSVQVCQYGSYASAAVTNYNTSPQSGQILYFRTGDGALECLSNVTTQVGAMRTALDTAGMWWGASMHDGSCMVFSNQDYTKPQWTYSPPSNLIGGKSLSVAYGFDLKTTSNQETVIAVGANIESSGNGPMGCLYLLQSIYNNGTYLPELKWLEQLEYSPNPGVNMDLEAQYVTATDGKPGESNAETPGNFYLYERASGVQVFKYPTPIMNWPMSISSKANAIFAASDTGMAYYWKG